MSDAKDVREKKKAAGLAHCAAPIPLSETTTLDRWAHGLAEKRTADAKEKREKTKKRRVRSFSAPHVPPSGRAASFPPRASVKRLSRAFSRKKRKPQKDGDAPGN